MKKLLSSLLIIAALGFVACDSDKKTDKTEAEGTEKVETPGAPATPTGVMAAVAHVCGADCKDGNHMYAHGEVGHTCTEACGAAHTCTDKCKARLINLKPLLIYSGFFMKYKTVKRMFLFPY